jgi:UDP-glucose:(heptosyl)LPS alpha-1,3-glucosyltransferase
MSTPSNQRRVALMLPRLSRYGGVEDFAWRLAQALANDGHAVDFLCSRRECAPPEGVRPRVLGRLGLARSAKALWFALAAERLRRREGYDCALGLGKTLRQDLLRVGGGPTEVFWRLSARAWPEGLPRAWKTLRRRLSPAGLVSRWLEREGLRQARRVVCVSHRVEQWLFDAHPWLEKEKTRVIYNRPDLARFLPSETGARQAARARFELAPGEIAVATAGTNFALKGVGTLIEALALLPPRYVALVAGGRGAGRWARRAEALGLTGRVRFLGRVSDMEALYAASDAFCLPSFYDACSNAVLEALACGLPVISTEDNGSSFFLPPERVLRDPADAASLARLVREAAPGILAEAGPAFAWPADVAAGIEPYLALVRELTSVGEPRK